MFSKKKIFLYYIMAYAKSYKKTTNYTYNNKKRFKSVNKYAQRKQIINVSKQVSLLRNQSKKTIKLGIAANGVSIANPCTVVHLTNPGNLARIFDDAAGSYVSTKQRLYLDKFNLDLNIKPATEWSTINMTMFIVSLHKASARDVLADTSDMTSFTNGRDYYDYSNLAGVPQGQTLLNLKRFKIHMVKRFQTRRLATVVAFNTTSTALHAAESKQFPDTGVEQYMRTYKKFSLIGKSWFNSSGPWTELSGANLEPSTRLYLMIFNNNYSSDGQYPVADYTGMLTAHEL